jgi:transposase
MEGYVGIDVALLRDGQREAQHFSNTPTGFAKLHAWLSRRLKVEAVQVCLEATGQYSQGVADFLFEQGYWVSLVNPARISAYGRSQLSRNKTDQLDAALIADFCRTQQPPRWTPPSAEVRHLQALVRHLEDLTSARQQARNRLSTPVQTSPVQDHCAPN